MEHRNLNHNSIPEYRTPPSVGAVAAYAADAPLDGDASLGIHAKFQATLSHKAFRPRVIAELDKETGELPPQRDAIECRLERFALQSAVRRILPDSRTSTCLRLKQKHVERVEVFRSTKHNRAHYGGLQTCSSVWACPVCAAKIAERRRQELLALINAHRASGGVVYLITINSHGIVPP